MKEHWNTTYTNSPEEKLGWYESDVSPTLKLIHKTGLPKDARILNVGAGSTTLVNDLLSKGFNNLIATDISDVSLIKLKKRLGSSQQEVEFIVDDLTAPTHLNNIEPVDLWIDRAVLHFFNEAEQQNQYFDLLRRSIRSEGFALLAEYNLDGATKCAGLAVHRCNKEMLQDKLGGGFKLIDNFNHIYTMPSGDLRPYIYTLFQKKGPM